MNKKAIKRLVDNKKLSILVEKYNYGLIDFLSNDDDHEMTKAEYEMLKNHKVKVEFLDDDPNYDYIIKVDNFEAYCIFVD